MLDLLVLSFVTQVCPSFFIMNHDCYHSKVSYFGNHNNILILLDLIVDEDVGIILVFTLR